MMRYQELCPGPELARYIKCYWFLKDPPHNTENALQPILPDGCIELVLNLGAHFQRSTDRGWQRQPLSMIVGQTGGPVVVAPTGPVDLIGVRFQPWGARHFLDLHLADLSERTPALEDVSTALFRSVRNHDSELRELRSVPTLERILLHARRLPARNSESLERAARLLVRARGQASVSRVAREAGVTNRQLERQFLRGIGVGPKRLARVLRFQRALSAGQQSLRPNWAEIAAQSGYFDQTHLIRDFRKFAGCSPGSLELGEDSLTLLSLTAGARNDRNEG
jgi:AraC-like DNA-binding protein